MSGDVDPAAVLRLLAADVPRRLHQNVLLTGSLAAAYHHRAVRKNTVRTKDADLVVQPAGALEECKAIASELLAANWRPEERMTPGRALDPDDKLKVIRLLPPRHDAYFVELLGMPRREQHEAKKWERVELQGTTCDGWYVVPCFRYMALFQSDPRMSELGIAYASPPLMALANLLAHPSIGPETIADTGTLRSAKDLGRVLALARLAGTELEDWPEISWGALSEHFPEEATELAERAQSGIRALLNHAVAFGQAYELCDAGLLTGLGVTREAFEDVAKSLIEVTLARLVELAGG